MKWNLVVMDSVPIQMTETYHSDCSQSAFFPHIQRHILEESCKYREAKRQPGKGDKKTAQVKDRLPKNEHLRF